MTLIKNLNKNIVKKNIGFNLREDLNFSDDGNYFRGFDYKGLPITTLRSDDITYLSVRVDYLNKTFTFDDWRKTEEYKLEDEFNGVSEVDLDKLIDNCERILAKVAELEEKAQNEVIDMTPVKERAHEEIALIDETADEVKANLKWWELDSYKLRYAQDYLKSLLNYKKWLTDEYLDGFSQAQKRSAVQRLNNYGYVQLKADNFYIEQLKEMLK